MTLLGIPGDNTYSNYQEAQRAFWRSTVLPLVTRTAKALSSWLAPAYASSLDLKPDLDQIEALDTALDAYAALRRRRYRALPHFWRFGRGWLRRVETTLARARALAAETAPSSPKPEGDPEMTTTTTDPATGKWWGHSITIWGTIVTLLSTVLPALAPVTGIEIDGETVQDAGSQVVDAVQAVGALIGTLMTIVGRVRASEPIQKTLFKPKG